MHRGWHIEGMSVRPDHRMVAHTGFLTTARLLPGDSAVRTPLIEGGLGFPDESGPAFEDGPHAGLSGDDGDVDSSEDDPSEDAGGS